VDSIVLESERWHQSPFQLSVKSPGLYRSGKKQLAVGKAVISLIAVSEKFRARVFLSVLVDPTQSQSDIVTGEVDTSYLWGFKGSRLLLSHIEPCVLDLEGVTLMCSAGHFDKSGQELKKTFAESTVGNFEWTENGQSYLVSYWTIPMNYEFQVPGWVILLKTSKEGAFASIEDLQKTFILSIVVSVGLSLLLAIFQIRKRLVPVEKLREGTRQIAENNFAFKVQIRSNDEFDELAASLNSMADRLGRQFKTITTTGEIDRAVLSLLDTSKIVETILSRISEAVECDFGCLTLFDADSEQVHQWDLRWEQDSDRFTEKQPFPGESQQNDFPSREFRRYKLTDEFWSTSETKDRNPLAYAVSEAKTVIAASNPELFDVTDESFVASREGFDSCLGAPLIVKDQVLGVLSFYTGNHRSFAAEEIGFVKRLSDQAAIAIYNSQLYERTIQQAAELLKANKTKDEFLNVMSHELRTPLNIIMGYVGVLREKVLGDLTAGQIQALDTVDKQSQGLFAMINSVMEATFIQTGQVTLAKHRINPAVMLDDLKSRVALPADRTIDVGWYYNADLPTLFSDEAKLRRILQIFIDNAVKFTAEGSVSISANFVEDKKSVVFKVADTGIGIPQELRSQIFEIFRQVDNSNTREHGGLGLGLYIAKQFANLIGAEIALDSQVGRGSTFTLTIQIADDRVEKPSAPGPENRSVLIQTH